MLLFDLKKDNYISPELLKEYNSKRTVDSYPNVFRDFDEYGITFNQKEAIVVPLDKITRDPYFLNQGASATLKVVGARVGVNPTRDDIYTDIDNNKFSFAEVPPILLYVVATNTYYVLDGVTRLSKFDLDGATECIFEVFTSQTEPTKETLEDIRVHLGLMFNLYKKPRGEASLNDIQNGILTLVRNSMSQKPVPNTENEIGRIATKKLDALDVSQKLTTNQYNLVIQFCKEEILNEDKVGCRHFPNGTNSDKILAELGVKDTEFDKYKVVAASTPAKIFGIIADMNFDSVDYENIERVNLVFYIGTVSGATASEQYKDWKTGLANCIDKFMSIRDGFCTNTGRVVNGKRKEGLGIDIRFFGGVPQVWAYDEDIPMNKIVKFQGNKDINPNKHDIII